jgi:hypothetical protein
MRGGDIARSDGVEMVWSLVTTQSFLWLLALFGRDGREEESGWL